MCMTEPLWDSAALKSMFLTRANQHLEGADKSKVGVLLVGHGQPEDWDAIYPTQTEQENLFRQEIVEMFVQDGYRRENLSLAWMGFQEPRATEVVEALVQNGVEKIFYFAASISANAIHSEYDIPTDVAAAKVPPGVELVNLGAWGPDPLVIQAIREKILACDPGLGAVQTGAAPSTP
jgi:sirohydrochlorin ferrochelatase